MRTVEGRALVATLDCSVLGREGRLATLTPAGLLTRPGSSPSCATVPTGLMTASSIFNFAALLLPLLVSADWNVSLGLNFSTLFHVLALRH